ncbi:MAG TPA: quinone oxidoreductase [Anaerolineales bacterium]|nr:quinone oxidoreductase [Anaerolineales bacterium]
MKAIRIHTTGGPEVLSYEDLPTLQPAEGEVLIKTSAIGVNFIDIYHRIGRYSQPLPFTPGVEAAGRVEAVGAGVTEFRAGDRVAVFLSTGCYAEYVSAPAARAVSVPEGLDDRSAVAALVQGMTAYAFTDQTYSIKPGDTVLIHAAAGGLGLLLAQCAKRRGARVIGTTSTEAKAALAREAGCDEVILYTQTDFEVEVKRLTDGKGVNAVYDSVAKTTFEKGLNVLKPRGMMILCGSASGPAPMLDPNSLSSKGSLYLTRPLLYHYVAQREDLLSTAANVFSLVQSRGLKLRLEHTYPLSEAAQAHKDLEARLTTGKLLLMPG